MSLPEVLQDANQKYNGTTVGERRENVRPFYVASVNEGRSLVRFTGQSLRDNESGWTPGEITVGAERTDRFQLTVPSLGVFNVKDVTVHLLRHPNRQWQRGYNERVLTMTSLNKDEYAWCGKRLPGAAHPATLWSVFNPEYPECDEAFSLVSSLDYMARAWNHKYHYVMKRTLPHIMVAYNNNIIGYRIDDVTYLSSRFKHLQEELGENCKLEILDDAKHETKDGRKHVRPQAGNQTIQGRWAMGPTGDVHRPRDRDRGISETDRQVLFRTLGVGPGRLPPQPWDRTTLQQPILRGGPDTELEGTEEMGEFDGDEDDFDPDF